MAWHLKVSLQTVHLKTRLLHAHVLEGPSGIETDLTDSLPTVEGKTALEMMHDIVRQVVVTSATRQAGHRQLGSRQAVPSQANGVHVSYKLVFCSVVDLHPQGAPRYTVRSNGRIYYRWLDPWRVSLPRISAYKVHQRYPVGAHACDNPYAIPVKSYGTSAPPPSHTHMLISFYMFTINTCPCPKAPLI